MALYLLGIFMGAIDTGIVTPARPIIAEQLGVDESAGIWMLTIYTLAYAAAIPIMGKLADRNGRKPVYLLAIGLFGVGSLLCGLSQDVGSFGMLIASRAIQAIGGGGILPIATAEIGTEVPPERRGLALGLVGAVFGVANIFGASAGSLILGVVGNANWQWIFYVNVPISLAIIVAGVLLLPNHRGEPTPIDLWGGALLVAMILALLYGLRNLDYLDLAASITRLDVWPFLVAFVALLPLLILVERRAADPVLNLGYFTDRGIAFTLLLSLLSGVILMGVVFVPQFAENSLRLPAGSGGYVVIALGLTSGIGAPLSGRLTDTFGPKPVLGFGLLVSAIAAASIVWWAVPAPSLTSVMVSLCLVGLGLGFVIGSPLNYMMLERTPESESSSALATLSLVRSLGTTLAPAVMIGFLAQAGTLVQDDVIAELPTRVAVPALPHAAELKQTLASWRDDPDLKDKIAGIDLSALDTTEVSIDPGGGGALPADLVEDLRGADVTSIVPVTKRVAERMFAQETPGTVRTIQDGVQSGIAGIDSGLAGMQDAAAEMGSGLAEMDAKLPEMASGLAEMDAKLGEMDTGLTKMGQGLSGLDRASAGMKQGIAGLDQAIAGMDAGLAQQRDALGKAEAGIAAARAAAAQRPNRDAPRPDLSPTADPTASSSATPTPTSAAPTTTPTPTAGGTPTATPTPTTATPTSSAAPTATPSTGPTTSAPPTASGRPSGAPDPQQAAAQLTALKAAITQLQGKRDAAASERATLQGQLTKATTQRAELARSRAELQRGRDALAKARAELSEGRVSVQQARRDLAEGRASLQGKRDELATTRGQLVELRDAVPGAFDQALQTYLGEIDAAAPRVEAAFQQGLNRGFAGIYLLLGGACVLALGALTLVGRPRE